MNNKNIMQYNEKNQKHGLWEVYHYDGNLWFKCFYHNGKKVGYEESYYFSGNIGKLNVKYYHI
jgi:antitoxin component YwqK of YwqJK toxin-antitoxin module